MLGLRFLLHFNCLKRINNLTFGFRLLCAICRLKTAFKSLFLSLYLTWAWKHFNSFFFFVSLVAMQTSSHVLDTYIQFVCQFIIQNTSSRDQFGKITSRTFNVIIWKQAIENVCHLQITRKLHSITVECERIENEWMRMLLNHRQNQLSSQARHDKFIGWRCGTQVLPFAMTLMILFSICKQPIHTAYAPIQSNTYTWLDRECDNLKMCKLNALLCLLCKRWTNSKTTTTFIWTHFLDTSLFVDADVLETSDTNHPLW